MKGFFRKAGQGSGYALCAALVFILVCMAVAVLLQALAVLVVAVLAAALLLPHPLRWYAEQGADAVKVFIEELFGVRWKRDPKDGTAGEGSLSPEASAPAADERT